MRGNAFFVKRTDDGFWGVFERVETGSGKEKRVEESLVVERETRSLARDAVRELLKEERRCGGAS